MIPRQLFFIWLGDDVPLYAKYSMNAYKELNPDFKINFIHYNVTEIENIYFNNHIKTKYDELLLNSINEILNNIKKYKHTLYRTLLDGQRIYYHNELRFI